MKGIQYIGEVWSTVVRDQSIVSATRRRSPRNYLETQLLFRHGALQLLDVYVWVGEEHWNHKN